MAVTIVGSSPSFGNTFKNTWSVADLDIDFLISNRDSLAIPTDSDGNNAILTDANVVFSIITRGENVDSIWTISSFSTSNVTITVVNSTKTVTVTSISSDVGNFIIKAVNAAGEILYRKIFVFKSKKGINGVDGSGGIADEVTIVTGAGNIISSNLVDINLAGSNYYINNQTASDIDSIPFVCEDNIILNAQWVSLSTLGASSIVSDNLMLSGFPSLSSGTTQYIKDNLLYVPIGNGGLPLALTTVDFGGVIYLKNAPESGSNNINGVRPVISSSSVGIGNYPNNYNHGCFSISPKTSGIGGPSLYDSTGVNPYTSPYNNSNVVYQNLECWTNAIINGNVEADLVFTGASPFKIYYQERGTTVFPLLSDDIISTNCKNVYYVGGQPSLFVANGNIKILGKDIVTDDYFFTDISFLNINGVVSDIVVNKTKSIGTLTGSTIQFSSTTLTDFIPEVISASSNPCKWVAQVSIDDISFT